MVNGITYDLQNISAADLSHIFWEIGGKRDGVFSGCAITYSGRNLYLAAGYFAARGYLTKLTGTTQVAGPTVTSGTLYCVLVYEIDLSQTPSAEEFTQGSFKVLSNATGYPALTQEDLDNGGSIYQMSFARFLMTSTGISALVENGELFDTWVSVTVPESGWSNAWPYEQTISMPVTTADREPVYDVTGLEDLATEAAADEYMDSFNCLQYVKTTNGGLLLRCYTDKPTVDFKIKLRGV